MREYESEVKKIKKKLLAKPVVKIYPTLMLQANSGTKCTTHSVTCYASLHLF